MKSTSALGISFLNGRIQIAEVEHRRTPIVTILAECESSVDMASEGTELSAEHPKLPTLINEMKKLLKQAGASSENVSFALPPDPLFINILPVDGSISGEELQKYLEWELDQYFPQAKPKEFVIDSHGLPMENTMAQETFMVAVRRGIISFLQKAVVSLKLKLNIIDIDHFSTEKTLISNYPEILDHDIALIGLRRSGVDASLIHHGQMTDYRVFIFDGNNDPKEYILRYLKYLKQRNDTSPAALILHGSSVSQQLVISLREESGIKQTVALNALRKLEVGENLSPSIAKESYHFAAAIGLALRKK